MSAEHVSPDIFRLSDEELVVWMPRFVMEIRSKDGSYYPPPPPNTLYSLVMGLQRLLCDGTRSINLLTDVRFHQLRQVLDSEM